MINPAGIENVRGSIERPLTTDEERTIPNWLDKAWRELQRVVPSIPARTALAVDAVGYLAVEDVVDVLVAMVERKVRNPDGLRSFGVDGDDQTFDREISSGKIYVTEEEKASLAPKSVETGGGAIYSIPLSRL